MITNREVADAARRQKAHLIWYGVTVLTVVFGGMFCWIMSIVGSR